MPCPLALVDGRHAADGLVEKGTHGRKARIDRGWRRRPGTHEDEWHGAEQGANNRTPPIAHQPCLPRPIAPTTVCTKRAGSGRAGFFQTHCPLPEASACEACGEKIRLSPDAPRRVIPPQLLVAHSSFEVRSSSSASKASSWPAGVHSR